MRRILLASVLAFTLLMWTPQVFAQTQGGLTISPPSFELKANPGESLANSIKIENTTAKAVTLDVFAQNFTAIGDGGQIALTEEDSSFSLVDWVTLEDKSITVPAGGSAVFAFTLDIPQKAEPGSHYGAVVFRTREPEGVDLGSGANVTSQIGSLILLRLPGQVFTQASIDSFTPSRQFYADEKISFSAVVKNTGNVHVKPYGFITIKNLFGWKEQSYEVRGRNVLPGSTRSFTEEVTVPGIGLHTAELTLLHSDGGTVMKKEATFVTFQVKKTVPVLIAVAVIGTILLVFRSRIKKALAVLLKG
jgi:hypothetical protein